jgi:DNA-binding CsgD family transcriptional regulator
LAATTRELEWTGQPELGSATRHPHARASWCNPMQQDWRVQSHVRGPDARSVVMVAVCGAATVDVITGDELRIAARRAYGAPFKVLGSELGRSTAWASARVAGAMRKLGLTCEDELVAFFMAWPPCVLAGGADGEERLVLTYTRSSGDLPGCLSNAERRVVLGLVAGGSHAAIAHDCGIATRTVANHVAAVYRKLGVSSRIELLLALRRPPPGRGAPRGRRLLDHGMG